MNNLKKVKETKQERTLRSLLLEGNTLDPKGVELDSKGEGINWLVNNYQHLFSEQAILEEATKYLYPLNCYLDKEELWVINNNSGYDNGAVMEKGLNANLDERIKECPEDDSYDWEQEILTDLEDYLDRQQAQQILWYIEENIIKETKEQMVSEGLY